MLYRIHIPRILAYLTEREILAGDRMMEEQQEESYPLTPIDKIANGNSLLILKALLPYLPCPKNRQGLLFWLNGWKSRISGIITIHILPLILRQWHFLLIP